MSDISVVKRDGSVESLNLDKVHKMVEMACEGLAGENPYAIIKSHTYSGLEAQIKFTDWKKV